VCELSLGGGGGGACLKVPPLQGGVDLKGGVELSDIPGKPEPLRINLNVDGAPFTEYERRVNLLVCSLPSHRHSYVGFICRSHFIDS
jgi:hypothetical protein